LGRKSVWEGERALIDVRLFDGKIFSASALTQFALKGLSFAGQMLIPAFLMCAAAESPSLTGWLMAPMGMGMMCTYPWLGTLTKRLGIRGTSTSGASLALAGTLPFLYLSSRPLSVAVLAASLFARGMGTSTVAIPSITAADQSVRKVEPPMATTSVNIVQRLGGPTLTTVCASLLGWRSAPDHSQSGLAGAFTMSFALLCGLHLLLVIATVRLLQNIETT
jgi:MFS family permease